MSTKTSILEVSKNLFNQFGFTQIGMRAIAAEGSISLGNLTYHFPKKEDLVWALYLELSEKLDLNWEDNEGPLQEKVIKSIYSYYNSLFQYRFFMLELSFFMHHYENINAHYLNIEKKRKDQFNRLLYALRSNGLMFHETVKGYDLLLVDQWLLHGNFWLSQKAVHQKQLHPDVVHQGVKELYGILLPQMTLKGKKLFDKSLKTMQKA